MILLYGAYGFTGKLICEIAYQTGVHIEIAGRREEPLTKLHQKYGFPFHVVNLEQSTQLEKCLNEFDVVLNASGPFVDTAQPLVDACIRSKTHYVDITGEIEVFEALKNQNENYVKAGIQVTPGVGFDVVPTDMVANELHKLLPEATNLELSFAPVGGNISHGTLTTMVGKLGESGATRENGKLMDEPVGERGKIIDFKKKKRFCMTIPWGDLSTAFTSTEIPNIQVYAAAPKQIYHALKFQGLINPLLKSDLLRNVLKKYIDKNIDGPNSIEREEGYTLVRGVIENKKHREELIIRCPESYHLTAVLALKYARLAEEKNIPIGYKTPAMIWSFEDFLKIDGVNVVYKSW